MENQSESMGSPSVTIITSDWLIANSQEEPLRSHGIRVQNTQITEIGDNHELKAKYPEDEFIDGTGKILLPILLTPIHICTESLRRNTKYNPPEDLGILNDYWWPKVEDALDKRCCLQQLNGHAEMLLSGTTPSRHP